MEINESSLFDRLQNEFDNETKRFMDNGFITSLGEEISLWPDRTAYQISGLHLGRCAAIMAQRARFGKRYTGPTSGPFVSAGERRDMTEDEFFSDNIFCRDFGRTYDPWSQNGFIQEIRGEVAKELEAVLDPALFNYARVASLLRSGPGASVDVQGTPGTYSRLGNSHMSFTSLRAEREYHCICAFTSLSWWNEKIRNTEYGRNDSLFSTATFTTAPKTNIIDRGICTHASGNMAVCLATHEIVSVILAEQFDIDLTTQQVFNKELARVGSIGSTHGEKRTWEFCTADLTAASNYPLEVARDIFPEFFVEWLLLWRSDYMIVGESRVKKYMLSTMGNGYTFAVMTLFLTCIVRQLYKAAGLPLYDTINGVKTKTFAVYGDDIVCDKSVFNALVSVLTAFGFRMNQSKSFSTGSFRESCGGDYYDGYDIRPVFVQELATQADVFSFANRLALWGVTHSVPLPKTLALLKTAALELGDDLRVPNTEDVCAGFHVPQDCRNVSDQKFAKHGGFAGLDGYTYRALVPKDCKQDIVKYTSYKAQFTPICWYQNFACVIPAFEGLEIYQRHEVAYEVNSLNLVSVLLGTMRGEIRDGVLAFRNLYEVTRKVKHRYLYSPGWGSASVYEPTRSSHLRVKSRECSYKIWSEYVRRNLFA